MKIMMEKTSLWTTHLHIFPMGSVLAQVLAITQLLGAGDKELLEVIQLLNSHELGQQQDSLPYQ